jgi:hypothetical protein
MLCRWARRVLVVARRAQIGIAEIHSGRYAALFSLVRDGGNLLRLRRKIKGPPFGGPSISLDNEGGVSPRSQSRGPPIWRC